MPPVHAKARQGPTLAHAKARSKVGNAVRRGKAAHDYDDVVDDDAAHTK